VDKPPNNAIIWKQISLFCSSSSCFNASASSVCMTRRLPSQGASATTGQSASTKAATDNPQAIPTATSRVFSLFKFALSHYLIQPARSAPFRFNTQGWWDVCHHLKSTAWLIFSASSLDRVFKYRRVILAVVWPSCSWSAWGVSCRPSKTRGAPSNSAIISKGSRSLALMFRAASLAAAAYSSTSSMAR